MKDIEISGKFYVDILKMTIDLDFGKNIIFKNGFAIWEIQRNHIIPDKLGSKNISDTKTNRFELYFETEDLSAIYEELKRNGVQFLHEIHEESWGQRTIRIFDPDHHLIEIGESMKHFVTRLIKQGLSAEQVSTKTSIPVETVRMLTGDLL